MSERLKITKDERETIQKIEIFTKSIEKVYPDTKVLLLRSFLSGLAGALGATVGLTIILAIISFILTQLQVIPQLKWVINNTHIEEALPDN